MRGSEQNVARRHLQDGGGAAPRSGSMQDVALTLDSFIDHAAKWHGGIEVVSASTSGPPARTDYASLRAAAARLSTALGSLGVRRGDMVGTLAWNTHAHMVMWYAALGIGGVCHTLNPRLSAVHLTAMSHQARSRILAVGGGLASMTLELVDRCPTIEHVILLDGEDAETASSVPDHVSVTTMEDLIQAHADLARWGGTDERDAAGLCFTSGTTGAPKGVLYTHRSSYLHTLRLLQADAMGLRQDDVVLAAVPMFHANGWGLPFAVPAVGAKLVLPGRETNGAKLAHLIASEGVTVAAGVPTVWLGLADHIEATGTALPSLQRLFLGGAPAPAAMQRRLERLFGATVHTSWGMTELSPLGTVSAKGVSETPAGTSGRTLLGLDLRLTDADGAELPRQRGVEGRLTVRGPSVVARYFGHEELVVDAEGWFDTGDLAVIGDDGSLSITGRAKDLIKSGGEWINPAEIEAIASGMPGVAQVAVIARADEKWGERPLLVIEPLPDLSVDEDAVLAGLRGRVPSWWMPDAVVQIAAMPLAATGKIDKVRLRAEFGQPGPVSGTAVANGGHATLSAD